MKYGDRGVMVVTLQQALQREGLLPKNTAKVKHDDGIFGKGTKLAVMLAQKANGLVADGIVGDKTKEVLR